MKYFEHYLTEARRGLSLNLEPHQSSKDRFTDTTEANLGKIAEFFQIEEQERFIAEAERYITEIIDNTTDAITSKVDVLHDGYASHSDLQDFESSLFDVLSEAITKGLK